MAVVVVNVREKFSGSEKVTELGSNRVNRVSREDTFRTIFEGMAEELHVDVSNIQLLTVSFSEDRKEFYDIDVDEKLEIAMEIAKAKHITYIIVRRQQQEVQPITLPAKNAFDTLMAGTKPRSLNLIKENNKKDKLANDLIRDIQEDGHQLLAGAHSHADGHRVLSNLTSAIWYLDGRSDKIQDAAKRKRVEPVPER